MRHFVFRWFVTAFAVFVAAPIVGIDYTGIGCLLGASLLLGIINAFVRPILLFLSIPLILVTLGFFILIINALMLKFVSEIVPCFKVHGFWSAIFGAIIISFVSWLLSAFFRGSDGRVHVLTHHSQIKQVSGRVIEPGEGKTAGCLAVNRDQGAEFALKFAESRMSQMRLRPSKQAPTRSDSISFVEANVTSTSKPRPTGSTD